jgi:hypothetical protein
MRKLNRHGRPFDGKEGRVMVDPHNQANRIGQDPASWEAEASQEEAAERATRDGDDSPAQANHFCITSLQHWIDLCA